MCLCFKSSVDVKNHLTFFVWYLLRINNWNLLLTSRYTQEKDKIVVYTKEVDVLRKVSFNFLLNTFFNYVFFMFIIFKFYNNFKSNTNSSFFIKIVRLIISNMLFFNFMFWNKTLKFFFSILRWWSCFVTNLKIN